MSTYLGRFILILALVLTIIAIALVLIVPDPKAGSVRLRTFSSYKLRPAITSDAFRLPLGRPPEPSPTPELRGACYVHAYLGTVVQCFDNKTAEECDQIGMGRVGNLDRPYIWVVDATCPAPNACNGLAQGGLISFSETSVEPCDPAKDTIFAIRSCLAGARNNLPIDCPQGCQTVLLPTDHTFYDIEEVDGDQPGTKRCEVSCESFYQCQP